MIPVIKEYEPARTRLRIRNKKRLMVSLILIVLAFLFIIIPHQGTNQVNYKPFKVSYGDTYWQIAKQLQQAGYKPRADIRHIVHELIQKSGIKAHELREGDIIFIPVMEGLE